MGELRQRGNVWWIRYYLRRSALRGKRQLRQPPNKSRTPKDSPASKSRSTKKFTVAVQGGQRVVATQCRRRPLRTIASGAPYHRVTVRQTQQCKQPSEHHVTPDPIYPIRPVDGSTVLHRG
jgi:hypothetical protein